MNVAFSSVMVALIYLSGSLTVGWASPGGHRGIYVGYRDSGSQDLVRQQNDMLKL